MLLLPRPARPASAAPYFVLVLTVVATEPWRRGTYFAGAFDSVVIAKAILSLVALGTAVLVVRGRPKRPIGALLPVTVVLFAACTAFGGWAAGDLFAAGVIAFRLLVLLSIVTVLATAFDNYAMLTGLVGALATVGAFAVMTTSGLDEGRLSGGLPPLHPNELAAIASVCFLWLLGKFATARNRPIDVVLLAVSAAALVATGSRTSLFVLIPASVVALLFGRAFRVRFLVTFLVTAPIALWWLVNDRVLESVLTRDGAASGDLLSLSNRTIAWASALAPKSSGWLTWLGGGLALKRIEVEGQWWSYQILDSSWVSALVQGGYIGLALALALVAGTVVKALKSELDLRSFRLALVVFLAVRGFLESGLFDASTAFLAFTVMAVIPRRSTGIGPDALSRTGQPVAFAAPVPTTFDLVSQEIGQGAGMQENRLRWRAAVNCLALGLVAAGLFNFFAPRQYDATTELYAMAAGAQTRPTDVYQGTLMVAARMETYVKLVNSPLVTSKVVEDLSLDETPTDLASRITVENEPGTMMLTITARDRDPAQAQQLAAAVAGSFADTVRTIETADQATAQVEFHVVQPAAAPVDAASPRQLVNLGFGALAGGLLGLVLLLWPLVRIASSPSGQLRVVFLGPLADRFPTRVAPVAPVVPPRAITAGQNGSTKNRTHA